MEKTGYIVSVFRPRICPEHGRSCQSQECAGDGEWPKKLITMKAVISYGDALSEIAYLIPDSQFTAHVFRQIVKGVIADGGSTVVLPSKLEVRIDYKGREQMIAELRQKDVVVTGHETESDRVVCALWNSRFGIAKAQELILTVWRPDNFSNWAVSTTPDPGVPLGGQVLQVVPIDSALAELDSDDLELILDVFGTIAEQGTFNLTQSQAGEEAYRRIQDLARRISATASGHLLDQEAGTCVTCGKSAEKISGVDLADRYTSDPHGDFDLENVDEAALRMGLVDDPDFGGTEVAVRCVNPSCEFFGRKIA